jgi:hypothetical protein
VEGGEVRVMCEFPKRKDKAIAGTYAAHVRNMIQGVKTGWRYRMKIVYSHFPMKASVKGGEFVIENFLGERHPRKTPILGETKVTVEGDQVKARTPPHRLDIGEGMIGLADVLEEVARSYGYDRIPETRMADPLPPQRGNPVHEWEEHLRDILVSLGLQEVVTYDDLAEREAACSIRP